MTQAQVVFKTDAELKKATIKKLKKEGTSLKALLQFSMKAYIEGKIGLGIIRDEERWTEEMEYTYQKAMKDFDEGKNVVEFDDLVKRLK